jgi:hypothetical protein
MKYLSFSLWGDKPIYNVGAIRNSELWKTIYSDWQMVLYYDNSVPKMTLNKLEKNDVILINSTGVPYDSCWRFFASDIEDCEFVVFRDCDSRISEREYSAVEQWIRSGKTLHVMRDHPAHGVPFGANGLGILAGMWGIKSKKINLTEMINQFLIGKSNYYGIDQTFLQSIYSMFENDRMCHDEFFQGTPFPMKRKNGRFIGERINYDDTPLTNDFLSVL